MKNDSDSRVVAWQLAAALQRSEQSLRLDVLRGTIPAPSRAIQTLARVWDFETIRAWRPDVAAKIQQINAVHDAA